MKPFITAVTFLLAGGGFAMGSGQLVAIAAAILGFGFAAVDGLGIRRRKVTALSFFALSTGVVGVGNFMIISAFVQGRTDYVGYSAPEYYLNAAFLNYVGSILPHFGGWLADRLCARTGRSVLPTVCLIPRREAGVPRIVLALGLGAFALTHFSALPSLGRLTSVVRTLPVLAVFLLARWGYSKKDRTVVWCAFALAGMESYRALLFAYLRGEILVPWFAFAVGGLLGRPRQRTLATAPYLLVYGVAVLFFAYYGVMALVRTERIYGTKRIPRLVQMRHEIVGGGRDVVLQNPVVRRATLTKQSRIFDLVARNGLYRGESMSYYWYVFIPRFIWRSKPIIQKGGWFAHELGLAREIGGGRHSNAINMTIPGELYLNFGWVGAVLGCVGVGFILMLIWHSTRFWESPSNITGILLSFHLIMRCFNNLGPDMQSLVGYINTYLFFWGVSVAARHLWPGALVNSPARAAVSMPSDVLPHWPSPPSWPPPGPMRPDGRRPEQNPGSMPGPGV